MIEQMLATKALLEEVGTTPKPGLVDRLSSGGHTDMDYHTFVASTQALEPFFGKMARVGKHWKGSLQDLFLEIRKIGLQAEEAMFKATGGVNTHKGMLFSVGLLCAASGYARENFASTRPALVCSLVISMTKTILEEELARIPHKEQLTHGEQLYVREGIQGIRGEVLQGFASVRTLSLPWYGEYLHQGRDPNLARLQVLLNLMAHVADTNVLYRHGEHTLSYVQTSALQILQKGGAFTEEGLALIAEMDKTCTEKRISCGGSADLLGVTIFLYDLLLLDQQMQKDMGEEKIVNW
ncbi:triphosphoribosyl-dephospho-CoA synthase CitG [Sphaerochaeta sp. PS]|uniref:triphosphoribosyl-dephospho-CoA synthase CitG n=1 Tax=Sphaerochaeta sp. PS TaxID=3076336 RepID=UPI0028A47A3B|nr:triphosphoribosyl-dephospho-CoA synthase CitG [Sphaerochaeta sp. PS]MDT4761265.1 triphosphoribosyl-dephospho-CoA synthase CitG [Sphaerochaeta sp. PS]